MKPLITGLVVKRFRSFPSAVVGFDNPVFLVGRNGAGKSNFADVFAFTAEAMVSPLQAVFDRRGGITSVRNRTAGGGYPPNLGLGFTLGALNGQATSGRYAFEIKALPNYGFKVLREQCEVSFKNGNTFWFDRSKDFRTNAEGVKPAIEPSALCFPAISGDERFAPVFKALSGMKKYSIEPAKLKEMQDPDSGTALKADGSNAASVLQEILRGPAEKRTKIQELLEAIVPNTKAVRPRKHGNKLSLEFIQEWEKGKKLPPFEGFNMSDGTLRALGLLMAVFQTPSPSVLVIEEPEATIHPGALGSILDIIRRASKTMQVILTTHSPELLDAKWIQEEHLRIVLWEKGASHVLPPDEASRAAMKKHIMGAGELLRSNALQAADLFSEKQALGNAHLFGEFK